MIDFNRVLAVTDLSVPARHAVQRAAMVCKDTAATLELLHVANLAPLERLRQLMGTAGVELEQQVLDVARQRLQELAAELGQRFHIAAAADVVTGSLLTELTRKIDSLPADLLVCGSKGESLIRRFMLGTTALRLLSTATCPILVVKHMPHEPYQRLLVPVDFSPSSLRTIDLARNIAPHATIVLLHAFEVPFEGHLRYAAVDDDTIHRYRTIAKQEATQKLHALYEKAGLDPTCASIVVLHGDPSLRIVEQEREQECDLIVMGKHGDNRIEDLLLGTVTKHVLAECQNDILVSV